MSPLIETRDKLAFVLGRIDLALGSLDQSAEAKDEALSDVRGLIVEVIEFLDYLKGAFV